MQSALIRLNTVIQNLEAVYRLAHEILVLIAYAQKPPLNAHADVFFDFSLAVKAAPHECVIRTGRP